MADWKRADEPDLVRVAGECDDDAFMALHQRHQRRLRFTVSRFAEARADREDLEADVVGLLLANQKRALRHWRPLATFAAYLTTIAVNHCLRWRKRQERLPGAGLPELPDGDPLSLDEELAVLGATDDGPTPEEQVLQSADESLVLEALRELSDRDRLLLQLRFWEGLDGPAIADMMAMKPGTARKALYDALRRLERAVAELAPGTMPAS